MEFNLSTYVFDCRTSDLQKYWFPIAYFSFKPEKIGRNLSWAAVACVVHSSACHPHSRQCVQTCFGDEFVALHILQWSQRCNTYEILKYPHLQSDEKVPARSRFFDAKFGGFLSFSQKLLKIQKLYIPHLKALISSFLEIRSHRAWLAKKILVKKVTVSLKGAWELSYANHVPFDLTSKKLHIRAF